MAWLARPILIATVGTMALSSPVQTAIEAPGPEAPLAGTLLSPADPQAPVVLIVPGSGPVDRDGNGPGGLAASTYRRLAEGLAAQGIATVRIDKRGMFGSRGAVPDADAVTIDDYARDVHAWVSAIRRRTSPPCVWILGHSEGGLVSLLAAQDPEGICGLVLVATAGRPLGDVLRRQLRANPANAPILDRAVAAINALEAGHPVEAGGMNPALLALFRPSVQGLLSSEMARDPAALIAAVGRPILILQGERDIQVEPDDAVHLKHAAPAATLVLLPDVNHLLKSVTSDRRVDNLATYADPGLPLAPGVVDAIASFVLAHRDSGR